jgi:nucleoside triphosphate pyrophosphatase
VPFRVIDVDVEEIEAGPAEQVAVDNATRKALAGAARAGAGELVLGVDTVVALDGTLWGKPAGQDAARATLTRLAGRTHEVVSAVALVGPGGAPRTATETTRVTFHALDEAVIAWYLQAGEWRGRAGGYAVQGRGGVLVERIDGDYLNVVGLPVGRLARLWGGFAAFLAQRT